MYENCIKIIFCYKIITKGYDFEHIIYIYNLLQCFTANISLNITHILFLVRDIAMA